MSGAYELQITNGQSKDNRDKSCQTKIDEDPKAVGHRQARAVAGAQAQQNHRVVRQVARKESVEITHESHYNCYCHVIHYTNVLYG